MFFKSARVEGETTSKQILNDSYDSDNLVQVPSTSALASVELEESEGGLEVGESVNVPSSDCCVGSQEEETDNQATVNINLQDPSTWSNLTSKSIDYLIRNLPKHFVVIKDCDFSKSKRQYSDKERVVKEHMFLLNCQMAS